MDDALRRRVDAALVLLGIVAVSTLSLAIQGAPDALTALLGLSVVGFAGYALVTGLEPVDAETE